MEILKFAMCFFKYSYIDIKMGKRLMSQISLSWNSTGKAIHTQILLTIHSI